MNLTPRMKTMPKKNLVGLFKKMSLAKNRTGELWAGLMSRRTEITNRIGNDYISLQVYPPDYFKGFNPELDFTKWALVEVADFNSIPDGMEPFVLEEGAYAVFNHKGISTSIFQDIFGSWIPNSTYELDNRPHFEVLGEKYKPKDPNSEEEIWIPIK